MCAAPRRRVGVKRRDSPDARKLGRDRELPRIAALSQTPSLQAQVARGFLRTVKSIVYIEVI